MKVVIVGGGPRGLSALERVVERARAEEDLKITMFDPYGPGGKIWREAQPVSLKMNTVACQVTLFTDESLSIKGPVAKGPSLYEWGKKYAAAFIEHRKMEQQVFFLKESQELTPNSYCSRAFYGLYQKWFYEYIQSRMTAKISITFFKDTVRAVKRKAEKFQVYTQSVEITADKVILALGHQENQLQGEEQRLAKYASEHRLYYSSPKNAADSYLEAIKPQATVIIRGLGLSFFDYLTLLTSDRGGTFEENAGGLSYQPSGQEPQIIAGSTRGFPYHAQGINQKAVGAVYQPRFLKIRRLNKLKRKGILSGEVFFDLLKKEIELVYYTALLEENKPQFDKESFVADFLKQNASAEVLTKYGILEEERWYWEKVEHPDTDFSEKDSWATLLTSYLTKDVAVAKEGNVTGPFGRALDCLNDLTAEVRFMLANDLFIEQAEREWLWHWFKPLNQFLAMGPSLKQVTELKALIEAGIVTILGPKMVVETQVGYFISYSQKWPTEKYKGHFLIEARIHETNNSLSLNPLTQQLLATGLVGLHSWKNGAEHSVLSGAFLVEYQRNLLMNNEGQVIPGLFCYGIPTEGVHWLTATTANPGTNAWCLREADEIAKQIFDKKNSDKASTE